VLGLGEYFLRKTFFKKFRKILVPFKPLLMYLLCFILKYFIIEPTEKVLTLKLFLTVIVALGLKDL